MVASNSGLMDCCTITNFVPTVLDKVLLCILFLYVFIVSYPSMSSPGLHVAYALVCHLVNNSFIIINMIIIRLLTC